MNERMLWRRTAKPRMHCGWAILCFSAALALAPALLPAGETVNLFAAGDLTGWTEEQHDFFRKEHPNKQTWSVTDGVVRCDGALGNCGFLRYDKKLCDFTLTLEYQMSAGCNSGVGLRAAVPYTTLEPNTLPSNVGYEVQIKDDALTPAGKESSGAIYAIRAPQVSAARSAGEWNTLEIAAKGPRITVVLNGQTVQDFDQTQVEALKGRPQCGYLSLQNHGHDVAFRNVKLRED